MHDDLRHLFLTFPDIPVGEAGTSPDLKCLLYKGGAACRVNEVGDAIEKGRLGDILPERVALVRSIYEVITGKLAGGGSVATALGDIVNLRSIFAWADESGAALSTATALKAYVQYCGHLTHRYKEEESLSHRAAYSYARSIGQVLDAALEREMPMLRLSRIPKPKGGKRPRGAAADKQNLKETLAFGHLMMDICDATPLYVIWNTMPPLRIPRQGGGEVVYVGAGMHSAASGKKQSLAQARRSAAVRLAYLADRSLDHRTRSALVNLRIAAELMMFLAQTGMNLTQAIALPLFQVAYASDTDGYRVLDYKNRAGGQVKFNIYSEYRPHFDRYLEWRRSLFPESEQRLFPFIRNGGVIESARLNFRNLLALCKQAGVRWVPPIMLRNTRVNWLLRRSGDPELAAEMAQHTVEVLRDNYEVPSLQRAMVESTIYFRRTDPNHPDKELLPSVAPGECNGVPEAVPEKPKSVASPDCETPSGCLFCTNHRDIDTLDYLWALASFRLLKTIELSKQPLSQAPQPVHPTEHLINKASAKLTSFRDSNAQRREWVEEALARVDESDYHPDWRYLIEAMEGPSK